MKRTLLIASTILIAATMAGCQGGKKKAVADDAASVLVKVAPAKKEPVVQTIEHTASLNGYKEMFVVPAVAARIDNIYVEVGDKVRKGQVLVDMDKLQYNQTRLQLSNAELTHSRMEPVYEAGGVSQAQIDELDLNIQILKDNLKNLGENLEFRSPINGYVTGRYYEEGDLYTMSPNMVTGITGILQVMDIDRLKAYVGVSEKFFSQVYLGMPVTIATDVYPGREFEGKVSRITPAINPATRTFEVEVTIPNASHTLRPGMFARTIFNMGEVEGVTVEDVAIQRQLGTNEKYVFVINNGVAERRTVTTGRLMNDRVEVLTGLQEGEVVAIAGMSRLSNGADVEIVAN